MKKPIFAIFAAIVTASCDNSREVEISMHDWECRYLIHDGYNQGATLHYVDSYVENVDRSISFFDEQGSKLQIPYPYYHVEERPVISYEWDKKTEHQ